MRGKSVKLSYPTLEKLYETVLEESTKLTGLKSGIICLVVKNSPIVAASLEIKTKDSEDIIKQNWVESSVKKSKVEFAANGISIPILIDKNTIGAIVLIGNTKGLILKNYLGSLLIFASYVGLSINKVTYSEQLSEVISKRDFFISIAAHELKTPITTINGYIQLLKNSMKKTDTTEKRWVEEMSWETFRLIEMVNELLQVSRIKTGKLQCNWKECSLREIIKRVILDFKFNHPKHKIQFIDDIGKSDDLIIADFDKLMQVIINTVDNSAKFSPEGSLVSIKLSKSAKQFLLQITDTGKGISKEDLPQVFKEFYKGGNGHGGGMGLGLFLAKNIIEKHKGKIKIFSEINKGTTIEITLPSDQSNG